MRMPKHKTKMVMFLPPEYSVYYITPNLKINSQVLAIITAFILIILSIVSCGFYLWRLTTNFSMVSDDSDIYYGIQISTFVIICVHVASFAVTTALIIGIQKERLHLVSLWIIGIIIFISLEGVATVYCNILKDHIYKDLNDIALFELSFYGTKVLLNIGAMTIVMKFFRDLRKRLFWEELEDLSV